MIYYTVKILYHNKHLLMSRKYIQDNKYKQPNKYCRDLFGRERYCKYGDHCNFNHNAEEYKCIYGLKDCPNNCGNFCLLTSQQCAVCITKKKSKNELPSKNIQLTNDRLDRTQLPFSERFIDQPSFFSNHDNTHQCMNIGCNNMTTFKFCRDCYCKIKERRIELKRFPHSQE